MIDSAASMSVPGAIEGVCRALVVVPCGRRTIWDGEPFRGSASAAAADTGTPFRLNRQYTERFGDAWVVLSSHHFFVTSTTET